MLWEDVVDGGLILYVFEKSDGVPTPGMGVSYYITGKSNLKKSVTANPILFTLTELTDIQTLSCNNQ
jgi:hypothetical protein